MRGTLIYNIFLHPKIMHTPRLAERGEFRREEPGCQAGRVIKKPAGGRAASSRNLPAKPAGHPSSLDLPVPVITLGNCRCRSGRALTVLGSFFLAMARNTDIMRTAQRQLDSILGGGRLPDHSDIDDLPYIVAIVKETLRNVLCEAVAIDIECVSY